MPKVVSLKRNLYASTCAKCGVTVGVERGWRKLSATACWQVYCAKHRPVAHPPKQVV
jgi:hypothetical protein